MPEREKWDVEPTDCGCLVYDGYCRRSKPSANHFFEVARGWRSCDHFLDRGKAEGRCGDCLVAWYKFQETTCQGCRRKVQDNPASISRFFERADGFLAWPGDAMETHMEPGWQAPTPR